MAVKFGNDLNYFQNCALKIGNSQISECQTFVMKYDLENISSEPQLQLIMA